MESISLTLQKTLRMFKEATRFITEVAAQGGALLFVGTKRQAQDAVAEEARRCGMFYVNQRWLGGLLTNFVTIKKSVARLKELDEMSTDGRYELLSKKEVARLERERRGLEKNLSGIKDMKSLPRILFVIDSKKEEIAVREANRLQIPVVAVVDTNCDPDRIDHVIPGNDDALRAIKLFTSKVADAVVDGTGVLKEKAEARRRRPKTAARPRPRANRPRRRMFPRSRVAARPRTWPEDWGERIAAGRTWLEFAVGV